jgi:hypothetical protein
LILTTAVEARPVVEQVEGGSERSVARAEDVGLPGGIETIWTVEMLTEFKGTDLSED